MRIGIYFGDYRPEAGGAYTFTADLLRAVSAFAAGSKHSFVILCDAAAAAAFRAALAAPNVAVEPVPRHPRRDRLILGLKYFSPLLRRLLRRPGPLERAARRAQVELLWFIGVGAHECTDIPYIATVWDLQYRLQPFFPEVSHGGEWDLRQQFYAHFLRRAAYSVTGTETGKREIRDLFQVPEQRIRVLPLPTPRFALDAAPCARDMQQRFGLGGEYLLYPAQFWPHKNHINLILALRHLREREGISIALALPGADKGNRSYVERYASDQGVADLVHFLGFVSTEDLVALYQQALALAFVTYFGPDNIPPLEAFALSCPVVASDIDGAREQYGDAALLVPPSQPEAIARAILTVRSDSDLRARLVSAGNRRSRQWTATDYVARMGTLFDEFAAVRRNWPP